MTTSRLALSALAAFALTTGVSAFAQNSTSVSHSTSTHDGVVTHKTKVVKVHKRKTRHVRRVLGVKVGHKTATSKTVTKTTRKSNGETTTTVKTTH